MLALSDLDLASDPLAATYLKDEAVQVQFATSSGMLISGEGPNHYVAGDALITSPAGERWSVTRERFEAKYEAVPPTLPRTNGVYRAKPVPVLAKQISEPFTLARRAGGDLLSGNAGDWVLQYGPGDYGVIVAERFARVYRKA
jgi:hypothetical protein